jgi:hypothetical protein
MNILEEWETVEFVVYLSSDSAADHHACLSDKNRIAIIKYWIDVDYPKSKMIMADDLRRKIFDLFEGGIPKIKLSKFILAPKYRSIDDSDFVIDEVLTLLNKKCVEEVLTREKFSTGSIIDSAILLVLIWIECLIVFFHILLPREIFP